VRRNRETLVWEARELCVISECDIFTMATLTVAQACALFGLKPEEATDPVLFRAAVRAKVLGTTTASRPNLPLPRYSGFSDGKTPTEFLAELERYAAAHRVPMEEQLCSGQYGAP
jgi:hypothetical protein